MTARAFRQPGGMPQPRFFVENEVLNHNRLTSEGSTIEVEIE
jgi:hypothetical protein